MTRPLSRRARPAAALLLAACATTPAASGTSAPVADVAAFVVTLGNDTTVVDGFVRSANRLEGELVRRAPMTLQTRYAVDLDAAGRPTRMWYRTRRPDGSIPPNGADSVVLVFGGDSVTRSVHRAGVAAMVATATGVAGAMPLITDSYAMYELALRAARASGRDSTQLAFLPVAAQRLALNPWPARFTSPTSARVYYFGDPQQVTLDAAGRVLAVDATGTTNKVRVARVASANIPALAADFAAREASGAALAQTTRDTTRASVGGASLWVDYGRPVARGRQIFGQGGIVPPGLVWRTGANAATHFRTDRALDFGGTAVPAGTYTLYTLPDASGGWQLIVNRQTGQWGTVYDQARDLARIPLRVEALPTPVERFTIAVEPQGAGGVLSLSWDRTRLSAPFSVR
jgi:hypothetical protein